MGYYINIDWNGCRLTDCMATSLIDQQTNQLMD